MRSGSLIVTGLLVLALIAQGCGDDGPSRSDLLTSSSWKFSTAKGSTNSSGPWQDLPIGGSSGNGITYEDCAKDDVHTFLKSGDYNIATGSDKCSQLQPSVMSGSWQLQQDDNHLVITQDGSTRTYSISELSTSTFQTVVFLNPYYIQITYAH